MFSLHSPQRAAAACFSMHTSHVVTTATGTDCACSGRLSRTPRKTNGAAKDTKNEDKRRQTKALISQSMVSDEINVVFPVLNVSLSIEKKFGPKMHRTHKTNIRKCLEYSTCRQHPRQSARPRQPPTRMVERSARARDDGHAGLHRPTRDRDSRHMVARVRHVRPPPTGPWK